MTAKRCGNQSDGITVSLREAVALANASTEADTINFAPALEGQTLVLTGGELRISRDLAIDGDLNNDGTEVTVDGGFNSRLLNIADATAVSLTDLTLINGRSGTYGQFEEGRPGGAVFVDGGSLTMTGSTIRGSEAGYYREGGDGGAIFANDGSHVTITNSSIADNNANGYGGGIAVDRREAELVIRDSLIADNFGFYGGGGVYVFDATLVVENSTVRGNEASATATSAIATAAAWPSTAATRRSPAARSPTTPVAAAAASLQSAAPRS